MTVLMDIRRRGLPHSENVPALVSIDRSLNLIYTEIWGYRMPIYEFKCLECETFFEILVMSKRESVEMVCPKCNAEHIERVISTANHAINAASGTRQGATSQTRSCSSGSCTTYTIPGPNG